MTMLSLSLCLCLVLALGHAAPPDHHEGEAHDEHKKQGHDHHPHSGPALDRCEGLEMDAVVVNEEGIPYFFKGGYVFKGFHGKAELANKSFNELDEHHHLGHVDAAFRMHNEADPKHHDHIFLFLDHKVFSYYQHKLEEGYPKNISEVFPGIPDHLDAALQCPKPECEEDSVIFFKGDDIYHYTIQQKTVDEKEFKGMPNCTSAFRFMEHYYCFHGHQFSKFDPKTGEVHGKYPKEARDFFMRCSKFGDASDHVERERCSRVHLDAITSDDDGDLFAFRGHHYMRRGEADDTLKSDSIDSAFKELHDEVDAAFTYENHLYMIKGHDVYLYKVGEPHTHLEGYPKPLKNELGIDGPVNAAFICQNSSIVHVIKGGTVYTVDLKVSPRAPATEGRPSLFKRVDASLCGPDGVKIIVGNHFYTFESPMIMITGRALPEQHRVAQELFGCDH